MMSEELERNRRGEPKWVHHCSRCVFLATDARGVDWYVCGGEGGCRRALVCRSGNLWSDCSTAGICATSVLSPLERRAAMMGFEFTEQELARFGAMAIKKACLTPKEGFRRDAPDSRDAFLLGDKGLFF